MTKQSALPIIEPICVRQRERHNCLSHRCSSAASRKSMYDVVSGFLHPCCGSYEGPQRETNSLRTAFVASNLQSHQCSTTTSGTTAKLAQMHSMKVSRSSKRGFQGAAFQNHEHRAPSQNTSLTRSQRSDVKIHIRSGKSPIDASRGGARS